MDNRQKNAIVAELSSCSDAEATSALRKRIKDSKSVLPVFAMPDLAAGNGSPRFIDVGVMDCADMGNVTAAINTAYVMVRHRPTLIIFSGIAGSLNASWIRIGDVIFPRSVRTRYYQKLKEYSGDYAAATPLEKVEVMEVVSGQLYPADRTVDVTDRGKELLSMLDSGVLSKQLKSINIPDEWVRDYGVVSRPAKVLDEEISFSWGKVLSNQKYVQHVRPKIANACTTVDMESFGFLSAVNRIRSAYSVHEEFPCHSVVVRSVSDFAEFKELSDQDPQWRQLGLENMAIATRYLIQNLYGALF